jgi:hypothetical protein
VFIIAHVDWEIQKGIKLFNRVNRWRKDITLLTYLCGYAVGYSFFRKPSNMRVISHSKYKEANP